MSETALSAIAEINPGIRIPKEITGNDQVSFISMGDVSESGNWITRQTRPLRSVTAGFTAFEEGDVLVAKITPCLENGKGAHAQGLRNSIGFGSTEFHVLRAREGVHPRFVFHITQSRSFRQSAEQQMVGSAGQQRVQRQFFDEFLVKNFSQSEQRDIVQILDTLDTTIRETEVLIDKLKAIKQGLLHDLLTRGIDANGQLRPPQSETPQLYKKSPLGWIPKGWKVVEIGEVLLRIDAGWSPNCPEEPPSAGEWGVLKLSAITSGQYNSAEAKRLPSNLKPIPSLEVHAGDALLARANGVAEFVARTVLVEETPSLLMLSDKTLRLAPDQSRLLTGHLVRAMTFETTRQQIGGMLNGSSGQKNISQRQICKLMICLPSVLEQGTGDTRINEINNRLKTESLSLGKLFGLKAGLMDDLLTGRVRIPPLLETMQKFATPTEV